MLTLNVNGPYSETYLRCNYTGCNQDQDECFVCFCRTFHTAPEQGPEPDQAQGRISCIPIFQVPKFFQVVYYYRPHVSAGR